MKEILRRVECYKELGEYEATNDFGDEWLGRPKLPVLRKAWVAHRLIPGVKILVQVLLDTGNDITIVDPEVVKKLEQEAEAHVAAGEILSTIPIPFHQERAVRHQGNKTTVESSVELEGFILGQPNKVSLQPVFPLMLFLTPEDGYASGHGFISHHNWDFEGVEVWMGRDIFNQLVVTFDGPEGRVSISDPN
jgi:hypothetical protein